VPQDWKDLDVAARDLVAVQVYDHPGLQAECPDGHPKQPVTVGHRSAQIDIPLAALIECLWQNGFETIACCQSTGGHNPLAYIGFLSAERGATFFMEILTNYGIPFNQLPAQPVLALPFGEVQLRAVSVSFHPDLIPAVTAAMNEMTA
jgi:hypothetical protein